MGNQIIYEFTRIAIPGKEYRDNSIINNIVLCEGCTEPSEKSYFCEDILGTGVLLICS